MKSTAFRLPWKNRRFVVYLALTAGLAIPQILMFATNRSFFPFQRWALFSETPRVGSDYTYYILQGETETGDLIDLPPTNLTDGLTSRNYMVVEYVVRNTSFTIDYPHPTNVRLLEGQPTLPPTARMPDLLRAWGGIYNRRLRPNSEKRLVRIRLLAFRWEGDSYTNFRVPAGEWMEQL